MGEFYEKMAIFLKNNNNNNFVQVDMLTLIWYVTIAHNTFCFYLLRCGFARETQTKVYEQGAEL